MIMLIFLIFLSNIIEIRLFVADIYINLIHILYPMWQLARSINITNKQTHTKCKNTNKYINVSECFVCLCIIQTANRNLQLLNM